ncbi:MAG: uracil phosphoribosyltransferase [Calditrichaeota bacterium]|nr:uracil phosphoribosyltransferase [Calditrichota bacterium]
MKTPEAVCQVLDHALVHHKIARLRAETTPPSEFKTLLEDLSILLFYEATRRLPTSNCVVKTPLMEAEGQKLKQAVLLVPVLRAGLGMSNGISRVFPEALVGMIGMYRDHNTLIPVDYYLRLPDRLSDKSVFLLDPMLATGGSAISAIDKLKNRGAASITMLAIISAPEGIAALHKAHPDAAVFTAAKDKQLNESGYILPGLGDAGDRYFGV